MVEIEIEIEIEKFLLVLYNILHMYHTHKLTQTGYTP